MAPQATTLDNLQIANPCPVSWEAMPGTDTVRHCRLCERKVYDISQLTRDEAERFVAGIEGRVCLRFFRRADGKIMTRDCPSQRKQRRSVAMLILLLVLFPLALVMAKWWTEPTAGQRFAGLRQHEPFRTILDWVDPPPPPPLGQFYFGW